MKTPLLLSTLLLSVGFSTSPSFAAPHDLDGDGVSDIASVSINNDSSLSWTNYSVGTSNSTVLSNGFGENGNNLIDANWNSVSQAVVGTVSLDESNNIIWKILDGTSNETTGKLFGKKNNTVLSGGDFNGNGFSDAAVVRGAQFIIYTDMFAENIQARRKRKLRSSELRLSLKRSSDLPFFVNPDGLGDWVAVLRELRNNPGQYRVIIQNAETGQRRSIRIGALASKKVPLPVCRVSGGNYMAFYSSASGQTTIVFKDMTGATVSTETVDGDGEVLVGDFSVSSPGCEIAVEGDSGFSLVNPDGGALGSINPPSGISVDYVNITRFGASGGNTGGSDEYLNPKDGGWGFLWKPKSDSNGKLVVLLPYQYTRNISSCVLIDPTSSAVIETGIYGGEGNGQTPSTPREHFRFSKPGGQYPAGVIVRANLISGGTVNYIIENPNERYD